MLESPSILGRLRPRERDTRRRAIAAARLDVASPADRPPYCITLETLMAFAARVKAHVARCPSSNYAPALADWDKMQAGYAKLFNRYRCRRTR